MYPVKYVSCEFRNFRERYAFANTCNVRRRVCDVINSRLDDDLPTSVNGRQSDIAIYIEGL